MTPNPGILGGTRLHEGAPALRKPAVLLDDNGLNSARGIKVEEA